MEHAQIWRVTCLLSRDLADLLLCLPDSARPIDEPHARDPSDQPQSNRFGAFLAFRHVNGDTLLLGQARYP